MSVIRTFYIGSANDGTVPQQSIEDDAEGFEGLYHLMGIPTFASHSELVASLNPDFKGTVQPIRVTVVVDKDVEITV